MTSWRIITGDLRNGVLDELEADYRRIAEARLRHWATHAHEVGAVERTPATSPRPAQQLGLFDG